MHPATPSSNPSSKPRRYVFFPGKQRGHTKRTWESDNPWRAPEHGHLTKDMKRDYPRDDLGYRLPGRERVLVMDPRPTILQQVSR